MNMRPTNKELIAEFFTKKEYRLSHDDNLI